MLGRLAKLVGIAGTAKTVGRASQPGRIRAKFDAAQTTDANRRHWANADGLAADAACSPTVRATLRNRGRYEQFNNCYLDGQLQTLAADLIGRGPRLQLLTDDHDANAYLEAEFTEWARRVELAEKLALAVETRAAAGEVFVRKHTNPSLPTAVKLDLMLLEGDQVAAPTLSPLDWNGTDGIELDRFGHPAGYWILRSHPGDVNVFDAGIAADRFPASEVIHFFKPRRPGQRRGIPQVTSALPLYAQRRGFRQSVLAAARKVAELGAVTIESDAAPDEAPQPEPFEEIELYEGMATVMPAGWKGKQMRPEQPGTTFREFDDKLINESARPLSMPFNVAACNSSSYNYASGRLDHQTYDRMLDVDHLAIELKVLDRVLGWFLAEAVRIPGYLPAAVLAALRGRLRYQWLWRGREHVDPVKEAEAQSKRLANRTTTLTAELARDGVDIETHLETLRREAALTARAGLEYKQSLTGPQVTTAMEVLARLGRGELASAAAIELLIALGIPRTWAVTMAMKQQTVAPPPKPAEPGDPQEPEPEEDEPVGASRLRELGLNGTSNGVHHA